MASSTMLAGAAGTGPASLLSHCRFKFSSCWAPTPPPFLPHRHFYFLAPARTVRSRTDGGGLSRSSMSQAAADGPLPAGAARTEEKKDADVDVVVQYMVLRRDLIDEWPLGSVVTQGCHASVSAIWSHRDDPITLQYCSSQNIDSMHKVTLEVKGETQMLNLVEKLKAGGIAHKLWIEQPENIPTCLATKPYPKSAVSSFFKKLKLCK